MRAILSWPVQTQTINHKAGIRENPARKGCLHNAVPLHACGLSRDECHSLPVNTQPCHPRAECTVQLSSMNYISD